MRIKTTNQTEEGKVVEIIEVEDWGLLEPVLKGINAVLKEAWQFLNNANSEFTNR